MDKTYTKAKANGNCHHREVGVSKELGGLHKS